jgi:hypothetical protein
MAYNEKLVSYIRQSISRHANLSEVEKIGGLSFILNDKFCIRVSDEELLGSIDPHIYEAALKKRMSAMDL